jgi:hypothetical protein
MGREADLLRMLEPVVRPGGLPQASRAKAPPIEGRDFESLLAEAAAERTAEPDETDATSRSAAKSPDPLQGLTGVDRIENATLRALISDAASSTGPAA